MTKVLTSINENNDKICDSSIDFATILMDNISKNNITGTMEKYSAIMTEAILLVPKEELFAKYFMGIAPVLKAHLSSIKNSIGRNGDAAFVARCISITIGTCLADRLYRSLSQHATIKFANLNKPEVLLAQFDNSTIMHNSFSLIVECIHREESVEIFEYLYGLNIEDISELPDTEFIKHMIDYIIPSYCGDTIYDESWKDIKSELESKSSTTIFLSYTLHYSLKYMHNLIRR